MGAGSSATSGPEDNGEAVYGLRRPTIDDARQALRRVHTEDTDGLWASLLHAAGLRGAETADDAVDRLAEAMLAADPVTVLAGRSLLIRLHSHRHLTKVRHTLRSAQ